MKIITTKHSLKRRSYEENINPNIIHNFFNLLLNKISNLDDKNTYKIMHKKKLISVFELKNNKIIVITFLYKNINENLDINELLFSISDNSNDIYYYNENNDFLKFATIKKLSNNLFNLNIVTKIKNNFDNFNLRNKNYTEEEINSFCVFSEEKNIYILKNEAKNIVIEPNDFNIYLLIDDILKPISKLESNKKHRYFFHIKNFKKDFFRKYNIKMKYFCFDNLDNQKYIYFNKEYNKFFYNLNLN